MVFNFSFKQQRFAKWSLYIPARCLMQAFFSHPHIISTGPNLLLSQLVLLQGCVAKMIHIWNYREVLAVLRTAGDCLASITSSASQAINELAHISYFPAEL